MRIRPVDYAETARVSRWMVSQIQIELPPAEWESCDSAALEKVCADALRAALSGTEGMALLAEDHEQILAVGLLRVQEDYGQRTGYLHYLLGAQHPAAVVELIKAFRPILVSLGTTWVHAELTPKFPLQVIFDQDPDWRVESYMVRRYLQRHETAPQAPEWIRVRGLQESDTPHVLHGLLYASWNGLDPRLREHMNKNDLLTEIKEEFLPLSQPSRRWFIAETTDGEFAGHALFEVDVPHPLTGVPEARLVDVFTVDSYRNRGLAKYLGAVGAQHCAELGFVFLSGTVEPASSPSASELVPHLTTQNWWVALTILGQPVRQV